MVIFNILHAYLYHEKVNTFLQYWKSAHQFKIYPDLCLLIREKEKPDLHLLWWYEVPLILFSNWDLFSYSLFKLIIFIDKIKELTLML